MNLYNKHTAKTTKDQITNKIIKKNQTQNSNQRKTVRRSYYTRTRQHHEKFGQITGDRN